MEQSAKKLNLVAAAVLAIYGLLILSSIILNWNGIEYISPLQGPGFRVLLTSILVYGLVTNSPWSWWCSLLYSSLVSLMGAVAIIIIIFTEGLLTQSSLNEYFTLYFATVLTILVVVFLTLPVLRNWKNKS